MTVKMTCIATGAVDSERSNCNGVLRVEYARRFSSKHGPEMAELLPFAVPQSTAVRVEV